MKRHTPIKPACTASRYRDAQSNAIQPNSGDVPALVMDTGIIMAKELSIGLSTLVEIERVNKAGPCKRGT